MKEVGFKIIHLGLLIIFIIQAWFLSYYIDFFKWSIAGAGLALMVIPFIFTPLSLIFGGFLVVIEKKRKLNLNWLNLLFFILLPIVYSVSLLINSEAILITILSLIVVTIAYLIYTIWNLFFPNSASVDK